MDSVQSLLSVLFVLALLGGTLMALKRRQMVQFRMPRMGAAPAKQMELVERMPLGPHHALHLVRIGGRPMLVATTPSSCQVLDVKENSL